MKRSDLHFPGIYKFTNKTNGMVYVGQAGNVYKRLKHHKRLDSPTRFGRALRKYGYDGFAFEVLERVDDLSRLNEREQFWMDFYQCYDRKRGYNTLPIAGSSRGRKNTERQIEVTRERYKGKVSPFRGKTHSEEAKSILSQKAKLRPPTRVGAKNKPEIIERTRLMGLAQVGEKNPFYGKTHSEETKRLISQKATGRKSTPETRKKMSIVQKNLNRSEHLSRIRQEAIQVLQKKIAQIEPSTNQIIRIWDSVADINRALGLSKHMVGQMCRGPYYHKSDRRWEGRQDSPIGGYKWRYIDSGGKLIEVPVLAQEVPKKRVVNNIAQVCLSTGSVIRVWESAMQIKIELNYCPIQIRSVCRGYYNAGKKRYPVNSYKNFNWQYVE